MSLSFGLVLLCIIATCSYGKASSDHSAQQFPTQQEFRRLQQLGGGVLAGLGQRLTNVNSASNARPIDIRGNVLGAANRVVDHLATNNQGLLPNSDIATLASEFFTTVAYIRDGVPMSADLAFGALSLGPPADDRPPNSAPASPEATQGSLPTASGFSVDQLGFTTPLRFSTASPSEMESQQATVVGRTDTSPSAGHQVSDELTPANPDYAEFNALSWLMHLASNEGVVTPETSTMTLQPSGTNSETLSRRSTSVPYSIDGEASSTSQTLRGTPTKPQRIEDDSAMLGMAASDDDYDGASTSSSDVTINNVQSLQHRRRLSPAASAPTVVVIPAGNILDQFATIPNLVPNNGVPPLADGSSASKKAREEQKIATAAKASAAIQSFDSYGIPPPTALSEDSAQKWLLNLRS